MKTHENQLATTFVKISITSNTDIKLNSNYSEWNTEFYNQLVTDNQTDGRQAVLAGVVVSVCDVDREGEVETKTLCMGMCAADDGMSHCLC